VRLLFYCPTEVRSLLDTAAHHSMIPQAKQRAAPALARPEIEKLVPHRDPFLFIDRITLVDLRTATIVCRYDLARAKSIFEGHFPGRPLWPGVLQVEAIGQAGVCLAGLLDEGHVDPAASGYGLTHILGAQFIRSVSPSGELEIVSRLFTDGLFSIVVGQCLQHGKVCCVAALRGINGGSNEA
jgi:3-hydroxyacyl-[acyl-carrier-protein] dehydratase